MTRIPLLLLAVLAAVAAPGAAASDTVTVYRCTDERGRVALRDRPCRNGETQEVRTMVRPRDPPRRSVAAPRATPATPAPAPREVVIYRTPPRPLYECVTPDGERYTAEHDTGNPRWVPLWTLGYPVYRSRSVLGDRIGAPTAQRYTPAEPARGRDRVYVYPAGTWVRDECHPLPQQEVCARLRDERFALDRRYHSALQSEREEITRRQRGIDARLANDCGES
ncbi:MAG TPA: DUF4124 domain-containing protein [Lysobacter sp.]|nr:DUF4124 domain-containing protein [Lysobacter sp.]